MNMNLTLEEKCLCRYLALSLNGEKPNKEDQELLRNCNGTEMFDLADRHKVLSFLYDTLQKSEVELPLDGKLRAQGCAEFAVNQSYRLLFLTKEIVSAFEKEGIEVIVLKGCSAAHYYPVPEYRKSGDVDLLVRKNGDLQKAEKVLLEMGYTLKEEQHANHHSAYSGREEIDIELHTLLVEPFENEELNYLVSEIQKNCFNYSIRQETMGVELPVSSDSMQAFSLLMHMLQHFLRSGFGLKLLADWVVFWNAPHEEKVRKDYVEMAKRCGVDGFSKAVTLVCEAYLGLQEHRIYEQALKNAFSKDYAMHMIKEIIEAEEFGKSTPDRMVTLRSRGLIGYINEFHHQMKLNYPAESKSKWKWPVLWVKTLVVFLRNNRKLNRGSAREILKKAGERARVVEEMKLYE